ncbi:MAG: hypothetical protein KJO26_12980 [Deltaproteobacteria bacterium]|nr:hypothetical protein [Deltaproteobacteria bacterium]
MNTALLIGMVILGGVSAGWLFHHRSMRHMKPVMTKLAAEKSGKVESPSLFLMPKLRFSHSGTLKQYEEYKFFLDTACRFYDAVTSVVLNFPKAPNGI